jgi:hypothetical protein
LTPDRDDDDEIEQVHLRIATDKKGNLVEANQIHHYLYCADALAQMSFYDFCHCVQVETIKSSPHVKNTHETHLGVYRRHELKVGHPDHETHKLQEHTNEQWEDGYREFIPWVVRCSIPCCFDATAWALFALAHFKPFSVIAPLLSCNETVSEAYEKYTFSTHSHQVMSNWEAIHECEDEQDANQLCRQASCTGESKALSRSLGLAMLMEDDVEVDMSCMPSCCAEEDFAINQTVLLMQQCKWLTCCGPTPIIPTKPSVTTCDPGEKFGYITEDLSRHLKTWKIELKRQETDIANSRCNALNPEAQCSITPPHVSEVGPDLPSHPDSDLHATEILTSQENPMNLMTVQDVIETVGREFSLNPKQWVAFWIIAQFFVVKYIDKSLLEEEQLCMLMTGPGGTGKTHVVKAIKHIVRNIASTH